MVWDEHHEGCNELLASGGCLPLQIQVIEELHDPSVERVGWHDETGEATEEIMKAESNRL
eukprot:1545131-Pyramimonas_sp.AAC.1